MYLMLYILLAFMYLMLCILLAFFFDTQECKKLSPNNLHAHMVSNQLVKYYPITYYY